LSAAQGRLIIVDDFEPFRRFVTSILQKHPELQVICEVSDGFEAVQKAKDLKPDLILLDVGLPKLTGIEAAEQIGKVAPRSKILFVSQESSADTVREALSTGACGYVVKTDARSDLLAAVSAVLNGKRFVCRSLAAHDFTDNTNSRGRHGM